MKYKILSIIVFTLTMNVLSAAEKPKERDIKRAKEAYQSLSYIQAIKLLKPLVENDTSNNELLEMLAYSYKMVKNYDETLEAYTKLSKRSNVKPEWKLYYAEALANKQQYEKSVSVYRDYLKSVPNEKRASSFVNANLKAFEENRGAWNIAFTNINTLSADYAPMYYKEGLLFSSNRMTSSTTKRVFAWDNTPFSDLYRVEKLKDIKHLNADSVLSNLTAKGNKPYKFNDDDTEQTSNDSKVLGVYQSSLERDSLLLGSANSLKVQRVKGKVNSKYHEGSVAVFPDGSIIFTRNNFYKGSKTKVKRG